MGQFIVRSVNYGFSKGELSITQREGIITSIPKENKPRNFVKNCRTISLLNCVYKNSKLVGWFCCFTSQVNRYGHCGTVSSPNHTFSWAGLNKRLTSNLCTYFRL